MANSPKSIILRNIQAPGDLMMMTAAVRDLHRCYPGKYITAVDTTAKEVWENNPYLSAVNPKQKHGTKITVGYPLIHRSNQCGLHFIQGFIDDLNRQMKLDVRLTEFKPDLHWSEEECLNPLVTGDYWVIISGGKADFTTKWWDPIRCQQVVDALRGKIKFVQLGGGPKAGGAKHTHPPLSGVQNMVGKTSLREAFRVMLHARGVITPVTQFMHLAAACRRPAVVLAGGREHYTWEAYTEETRSRNMAFAEGIVKTPPGTEKLWSQWKAPEGEVFYPHTYFHTIGELPCCQSGGCWKGKVGEGKPMENCVDIVQRVGRVKIPRCLDMILPEQVVEAVEKCEDMIATNPLPKPEPVAVSKKGPKHVVVTTVAERKMNTLPPEVENAVVVEAPAKANFRHLTFPITCCVLTYGNHHDLAIRALSSLYTHLGADRFRLRLGLNAVTKTSRDRIDRFLKPYTNVEKIYDRDPQIYKYPIMREMFHDEQNPIDTKWIMWFDDDSHIVGPNWLNTFGPIVDDWHQRTCVPNLRKHQQYPTGGEKEEFNCKRGVHMFGKVYYFHIRKNDVSSQWDWIKQASWYTGRAHRVDYSKNPPMDKIEFCTGGWWMVTNEAVKELNWPDPRIRHRGGDIMMGEAMHQHGFGILQAMHGVKVSDAKQRGYNEQIAGLG
jgi:ADP-heptose:LPS heptosyltransferase/GT2 family glycosyltransferase